MAVHPPDPRLVHPLPPAPHFVGRETELAQLQGLWRAGFRGVLALVGLGGAGKTAVAARFLDYLLGPGPVPRPHGLLVWSFYQQPDAGLFLKEAYDYFTGAASVPARGAGLLHLLREHLAAGGPHLLVLDGLERVQRAEGDGGAYGQIEDPLLRGLLTRVAEGTGRTIVLVTSRFPLTDLTPFRGSGYVDLSVGGLSRPAALDLLRSRGVWGDDAELERLITAYGAHALTLDHLGGLVGQFLGGDPTRAPEVTALPATGGDRQGLRLARLLRVYEEHLPAAELALLCRLCLLRRSATAEQLQTLFLCTPAVHARTVRELGQAIAQLTKAAQYPAVDERDLAHSIQETLEEALCQAPIAGPEEGFRQEILRTAAAVPEMQDEDIDADMAELARLYTGQALEPPSDRLPLSARDRRLLAEGAALYLRLQNHPNLPYRQPAPALEHAFQMLGHGHRKASWVGADWGPADVFRLLGRTRLRLRYLTGKHCALRRVRELCRLYQHKWSLAGPLAPLDAPGLGEALDALVERHLVLREADGSFSVHPAVRDHFTRLATTAEQGTWHDILREQMISLVERPGVRLPEEPATLDLVEEAIYHGLQAGRSEEAVGLYRHTLGGLRHLAWRLGEMTRGLRILRGFDPCPEPWDLAWFLRALGELDDAYRHNNLPCFRADIRLLQGRLPEVAAEADAARTAVAAFLMGQTTALPPDALGSVVPRVQVLLYLGRLTEARQFAEVAGFYHDIGWEGDRARCGLLLADAARRQADLEQCRHHLETASRWVLHSGSVEHLGLLHLVRARAARTAGDGEAAQRAVDDGLHLARQCGLRLVHIELLCEHAELCLARADAPAAERLASAALERASAADCAFAWGATAAGRLLGWALVLQERHPEARAVLTRGLSLGQRLHDPDAKTVERLLEQLPA